MSAPEISPYLDAGFNPRPREGAATGAATQAATAMFQSAPP